MVYTNNHIISRKFKYHRRLSSWFYQLAFYLPDLWGSQITWLSSIYRSWNLIKWLNLKYLISIYTACLLFIHSFLLYQQIMHCLIPPLKVLVFFFFVFLSSLTILSSPWKNKAFRKKIWNMWLSVRLIVSNRKILVDWVPKTSGVHIEWNTDHHSCKHYKYLLIANLLVCI